MGNFIEYDFRHAMKPCGKNGEMTQESFPEGKCVGRENCNWFEMCDLGQKDPPESPTKPLVGKTFRN